MDMKSVFKVTKESGIPLIGCIAFGVIDRGTNLLQIRPTSVCNLNCVFCSTDSGSKAKKHCTDYIVDRDYLIEYVKEIAKFKLENDPDMRLEANIDSVGEIFTYPEIVSLIEAISKIEGIYRVSMQTNGTLLDAAKIKKLEKIGVYRINLSINSLDAVKARTISGNASYSIDKIKKTAQLIEDSSINLLFAPVWVPGLNDDEIPGIIRYAKEICKKEQEKKIAFIGLQKYEAHKFGRRPKGSEEITYWKFYKKLEEWEKEFGIKLKLGPHEFGIRRTTSLPTKLEEGKAYNIQIKANGWMPNQMIGAANGRAVTLVDCDAARAPIGKSVKAKIVENKNNLYIGKVL